MKFLLLKIPLIAKKQRVMGLFMLFSLCASFSVLAQTLTGKVVSETGESLIGVSIKLQGTYQGTLSDVDGNFSLSLVADQATNIEFTYVVYEQQTLNYTLKAGETASVNVTLKPASTA